MTSAPPDDFQDRRAKALKRCADEIAWYETVKRNQRRLRLLLLVSIIVLSGLTPLLILIDGAPKVAQALPAAVAGMLTAISATFRVPENYARFSYTLEALKSEKFKYETRAGKDYSLSVNDDKALERFVTRMEDLIISEVTDWRTTIAQRERSEE